MTFTLKFFYEFSCILMAGFVDRTVVTFAVGTCGRGGLANCFERCAGILQNFVLYEPGNKFSLPYEGEFQAL